MAGEKALVSRIRARAFEMGLEARPFLYPAAVRSLVGSTNESKNSSIRPRSGGSHQGYAW